MARVRVNIPADSHAEAFPCSVTPVPVVKVSCRTSTLPVWVPPPPGIVTVTSVPLAAAVTPVANKIYGLRMSGKLRAFVVDFKDGVLVRLVN